MRNVFARSLACAFAVAALALGSAGAAHAGPPVVISVNETFVDDFSCGFPFNVSLTGEFKQVTNNNRTINVYNEVWTFSNPANGKTLTGVNKGPDILTANPDGSTTMRSIGIFFRVNTPGAGNVLLSAGVGVIQFPADPSQPPQVEFRAGPEGSPSQLCPYLVD